MVIDGLHGLTTGNYIGPKDKQGQIVLGPWSKVVSKVGIQPNSRLMKTLFVLFGVIWLILLAAFWLKIQWAKPALMIMAIGSLWYLPVGTMDSILQLFLLTRLK